MAITRKKKEEIVQKMSDIAKDAKTIVFAHFKGLSVANQTEVRRTLRAQNIGLTVAKKTLMKRGLVGKDWKGEMPELRGEIVLAYGEDELAPARELAVFVKKFPEQLAFAGGVFAGRFVDADEMKSIAAIPPLQTLRAQFVQLISSPLQRLAIVLSEGAKKKS